MPGRRARDSPLLDAIEVLPVMSYPGVADGRDPLQRSAVGGRRDDRTFDVLFTSTKADGAVPEMYFHLSKGHPVMPLLAQYRFFELEITLEDCVRVTN